MWSFLVNCAPQARGDQFSWLRAISVLHLPVVAGNDNGATKEWAWLAAPRKLIP
jgi:hypothetical protein